MRVVDAAEAVVIKQLNGDTERGVTAQVEHPGLGRVIMRRPASSGYGERIEWALTALADAPGFERIVAVGDDTPRTIFTAEIPAESYELWNSTIIPEDLPRETRLAMLTAARQTYPFQPQLWLQTLDRLLALEQRGIAHTDFSSNNILWDSETLSVVDFELARTFDEPFPFDTRRPPYWWLRPAASLGLMTTRNVDLLGAAWALKPAVRTEGDTLDVGRIAQAACRGEYACATDLDRDLRPALLAVPPGAMCWPTAGPTPQRHRRWRRLKIQDVAQRAADRVRRRMEAKAGS